METSQCVSIDSFSYSWVVNLKASFESSFSFRDDEEEASFIEMDPKLSPSKRFSVPHDFNFDFPISDSPFAFVYADDLISNGFFFKPMMTMESSDYSLPPTPSTSIAQMESFERVPPCSSSRRHFHFFRKYRDFLRPICHKIRRCRFWSVNTRMREMKKNWDFSSATSPRTSVAYSESSIHEAVLHCKRTIGNK